MVRTPTAIVTDLGTEFGVEVNREGGTKTCVLVGAIKIKPISSGTNGNAAERIVLAGNAVWCDGKSGGIVATAPNDRQFVRSLAKATTTKAGLLMYEGFDYPLNRSLVGQNGGQGFGGAWEVFGGATTVVPGLQFGSLQTQGNAVQVKGAAPGTSPRADREWRSPVVRYGRASW